ncbi:uncharacterized protein LOC107218596 isoform X2 [Neodiprion lecontei]|uniref:Uncharacterized protein LOC107218596 isoform X2 n=1 Tax=Neodiprion lecontei TaxID=441921 RepID=A0A6J0BCV0_NEOLC|nr:uncharacterized protein LOC107218596 isoform X2 [Neodiprion lecontei]
MNLLGILLVLLISSSSVLCRRIYRQDLRDVAQDQFSNFKNTEKVGTRDGAGSGGGMETQKKANAATDFPLEKVLRENKPASVDVKTEGRTTAVPDDERKLKQPMSAQKIGTILQQAILKIIMGELTTADMMLLKSLNYDAEMVRKIREEEFKKRENDVGAIDEKRNLRNRIDADIEKLEKEEDSLGVPRIDYDAYNNQAVDEYENSASFNEALIRRNDSLTDYEDETKSSTETKSDEYNGHSITEPRVVFRLRYNDSAFDPRPEENPMPSREVNRQTTINGTGNNFPTAVTSVNSSSAPVDYQIYTSRELYNFTTNYFSSTRAPEENNEVDKQHVVPSRNQTKALEAPLDRLHLPDPIFRNESATDLRNRNASFDVPALTSTTETTISTPEAATSGSNENRTAASNGSHRIYKGLKWIQDDVYQVIPEYIDFAESENAENETSTAPIEDAVYQNLDEPASKNQTSTDEGMENDATESVHLDGSESNGLTQNLENLSSERPRTLTEREAQKQKTIEEIIKRVLWITGRQNATEMGTARPRKAKMAMFSPTCQVPHNTDVETWRDPYSINMEFHLNLTTDQHVVAAKLRLFKLPQVNVTTAATSLDGAEDDEKKIRISVFYYTRSLKKHRSKKVLMDSKMISLTATGEHLALDAKQGLRFWRSHSSHNHGILVQVEDQDGRPLQPSRYIETPNCQNSTDSNQQDDKAYQRVPALFVAACTRYVRFVDGEVVTYEDFGP